MRGSHLRIDREGLLQIPLVPHVAVPDAPCGFPGQLFAVLPFEHRLLLTNRELGEFAGSNDRQPTEPHDFPSCTSPCALERLHDPCAKTADAEEGPRIEIGSFQAGSPQQRASRAGCFAGAGGDSFRWTPGAIQYRPGHHPSASPGKRHRGPWLRPPVRSRPPTAAPPHAASSSPA